MTEEQNINNAKSEGWRCYGVWVASLNPSTIPYATLRHTGMQILYRGPQNSTLSEAKANADLIVVGTVLSISPLTTTFGTTVTVSVSQVLKGAAGTTVKFNQASHLEPADNGQSIIIVDAYPAPLLLPGESVFLFLNASSSGYGQQNYTGTYYVRNGRIQALDVNPFKSKVNGQLAADFIAAVAAA